MNTITLEVRKMSSKGSSWYVNFDTDALEANVNEILFNKLKDGLSDKVKKAAAGEYALAVFKYVPFKSGKLASSAEIVPDGDNYAIRYSARGRKKDGTVRDYDYAAVQYLTPFENRTTPGTYDHWNRHLTRLEREEFYHRVADLVLEGMNE